MKRFILAALAAFLLAGPSLADSDIQCQVVAQAFDPTEAGGTDDYLNLADGTFGTSTTADDEFTVPVNVKVWGLRVDVNTAPTANDTWQITVVDDGVATLVTCDITGASDTSCQNVNNVATIVAGSDLMVLVDSSTGSGDPATTSELRVAFCIDR